jgi:beta-lactamase regulating signal transducer with metallopeptidase domain
MPVATEALEPMSDLVANAADLLFLCLWLGALAAIPSALLAAVACRLCPLRPATRHLLWAAVLLSFLTPPVGLALGRQTGAHDGLWSGLRRLAPAGQTASVTPTASATPTGAARGPESRAVRPLEAPPALLVAPVPLREAEVLPTFRPTLRPTILPTVRAEAPLPAVADPSTAPQGASPKVTTAGGATDPTAQREARRDPVSTAPLDESRPAFVLSTVPPSPANVLHRLSAWWAAVRPELAAALARAPTLPTDAIIVGLLVVWSGGTALLLLGLGVRVFRSNALLRSARPAPEEILTMVRDAARVVGLASPPETLLIDAAVSPMVRCGLRPSLVLPSGLWEDLDEPSRRAVVLHELAHLKRRDHWLCWAELLVAAFYWWHPIAWWARRRVRDEAEASCDAWVTALLPKHRRAYAEALLAARFHVTRAERSPLAATLLVPDLALALARAEGADQGESSSASPSHAAPAAGRRARGTHGLSRRITMVMTQHVAPRSSLLGVAGAALLCVVGTFVTPGLACPPEQEAPSQARGRAVAPRDLATPPATTTGSGQAFFGEAPALEAMLAPPAPGAAARGAVPPAFGRRGLEAELQGLEAQLRALEVQLEALRQQAGPAARGPRSSAVNVGDPFTVQGTPLAALPAMGRATVVGEPLLAETIGVPLMPARVVQGNPLGVAPRTVRGQPLNAAAAARATIDATAASGMAVSRTYRVSPGRLEALVELMARDDVPICVKWDDSSIEVTAMPDEQETFAAFVRMIDPQGPSFGQSSGVPAAIDTRAQMERERAAARLQVEAIAQQSAAVQARARASQAAAARKLMLDRIAALEQSAGGAGQGSREALEPELEALEERIAELESQLDEADDAADEAAEDAQEALDASAEAAEEAAAARARLGGLPPMSTLPAPAVAPMPAPASAPAPAPVPASALAPFSVPVPPVAPAAPVPPAPAGR